jgi:hypothetical protein
MHKQERKEIQRIMNILGLDGNISELLGTKISLSDLNSLLLEVFRTITADTPAAELLKRYSGNRFVLPAEVDPIQLKRLEIDTLEIAGEHAYTPIQLSPVAPLGSCSVVATADQNKIISALRGTEVVADATNLLALHICDGIKSGKLRNDEVSVKFSTTHRHVRAQQFNKPGLVPHFHVFCMVASGKDRGSYSFEKEALLEHLTVYRQIFSTLFDTGMKVRLNSRSGYTDSEGFMTRMMDYIREKLPDIEVLEQTEPSDNRYYTGLQFSIFVRINGQEMNIGDGGFVDWPQQLLGSRKERMLISAIGLEWLARYR